MVEELKLKINFFIVLNLVPTVIVICIIMQLNNNNNNIIIIHSTYYSIQRFRRGQ